MTVPGFEFTIHVSNIQVNWPGNYGYFDCVLYLYDKFYKNEKRDIEQIIVKMYNLKRKTGTETENELKMKGIKKERHKKRRKGV